MSYALQITFEQTLIIEDQFIIKHKKRLSLLVLKLPSRVSGMLISEYIQGRRVMPLNSPIPGKVDLSITPWIIEIIDNMSPLSHIKWTFSMKAAQVAMTFGMECVIAYTIGESPCDMMFASGTADLLETWAGKRLDPAIDSCGLRHLVKAQVENRKSRRSGDKLLKKEFPGGFLNMVTLGSSAQLRSDSVKRLMCDEIDEAPAKIKGQGNPLDIVKARMNAYGDRAKAWYNSTPTETETSNIYERFKLGDQREFFVYCPHCGREQYLQWGEAGKFGIQFEKDENGNLVEGSVWYMCIENGCKITEAQKYQIVRQGRWKPTAKSTSKKIRSYHINSLYAPPGAIGWEEIVMEWILAQKDSEKLKTFINLYLGEPFNEQGERPKLTKLFTLRGNYTRGIVPDGVIFLTASVDVQRGVKKSNKNYKKYPPRLEVEICGHGYDRRTFSIDYFQIPGKIDNAGAGAWKKLFNIIDSGGFTYKDKNKNEYDVQITVADCRDGKHQAAVYSFCQSLRGIYPISGMSTRVKRIDKYRPKKVAQGLLVLQVITDYYKNLIYQALNIPRNPTGTQKPGFCEFPADYQDEYFEMLRAEERRSDGTFFKPSGRRNESLDLRVYNLAAADFQIDSYIKAYIDQAKKQRMNPAHIAQINRRYVLDRMIEERFREKPIKK